LLVAGFLGSAVILQATLCVNSLAHTLGRRTYDQQTSARDSTITALNSLGEGYHSFRHRFPFDYRNGVSRWAYVASKWLIWWLARLRLVNTMRTGSRHKIARALGRRAHGHRRSDPRGRCPASLSESRDQARRLRRAGSTRQRRELVGTDPWQDAVGRGPLRRR